MSKVLGRDMMLEIARGNIPGVSHINKFGRNGDVSTTEDIWSSGSLWVPPTSAVTHDIASGSGNDTGIVLSTGSADTGSSTELLFDAAADFISDGVAVGDVVLNDTNIDHSIVVSVTDLNNLVIEPTHHLDGFNAGNTYRVVNANSTGASVIHLYGLDSNMDEQEEFIVLNGAGNVATIRTYWRIWRMHLDGAASRITNNVGTITATAQGATIQATIPQVGGIGLGQTLDAKYTIPAGKTGYMTSFSASIFRSAVGALAELTLRQTKFAGLDGAGSIAEHYSSIATDGSSHIHHPFRPYKVFEQMVDIWVRAETVSATCAITAAFDIILVDD